MKEESEARYIGRALILKKESGASYIFRRSLSLKKDSGANFLKKSLNLEEGVRSQHQEEPEPEERVRT